MLKLPRASMERQNNRNQKIEHYFFVHPYITILLCCFAVPCFITAVIAIIMVIFVFPIVFIFG